MLVLFSVLISNSAFSQEIWGNWKTIDDETGKAKSYVEIYKKDGKAYAKITKLLEDGKDETTLCDECPDDEKFNRKDKPIVGMDFVAGLELNKKNVWEADDGIIDPKNGKIYDCEMELNPENSNELLVRGYIFFIYRTQVWHRMTE